MQEYSSMNGKVLDSYTLHKPAGWNATAANKARAAASSNFVSNFTDSNVLDTFGWLLLILNSYIASAQFFISRVGITEASFWPQLTTS
jgi:hypothetical protein